MNNVVQMQVLQGHENASYKEFCFHLFESSSTTHMISQISSDQQIHDQIQILSILKSIVHIDDKGMF